jgi:CheY-like chemotaxis protein
LKLLRAALAGATTQTWRERLTDRTILDLFADKRILVVETESFLGDEVRRKLAHLGATVVGVTDSLDEALHLLSAGGVDAAILDVHLGDDVAFPLAERLEEMSLPFVFATGYDAALLRRGYPGFSLCDNPTELAKIAKALWKDGAMDLH